MSHDPVLITEDWLKSIGFKWHQMDRQPDKHWLLWIGRVMEDSTTCTEDLGIELAPVWFKNHAGEERGERKWFCWLRSDHAHKYSRFLHVRHIATQADLIKLYEGLTGREWLPENHFFGSALPPKLAERERAAMQRLDRCIAMEIPWREHERDLSQGGALPEHLEELEKAKQWRKKQK